MNDRTASALMLMAISLFGSLFVIVFVDQALEFIGLGIEPHIQTILFLSVLIAIQMIGRRTMKDN